MYNENLKELTVRGIILGALITVIFTASNVYLGLKVGVTFASSIISSQNFLHKVGIYFA